MRRVEAQAVEAMHDRMGDDLGLERDDVPHGGRSRG